MRLRVWPGTRIVLNVDMEEENDGVDSVGGGRGYRYGTRSSPSRDPLGRSRLSAPTPDLLSFHKVCFSRDFPNNKAKQHRRGVDNTPGERGQAPEPSGRPRLTELWALAVA